MDLANQIRRMQCVAKVSDLRFNQSDRITLVYFLCPCLTSKGIILNQDETGLTVQYVDRLSISSKKRLVKVQEFWRLAHAIRQNFDAHPIWADADALFLYSPTPLRPPLPKTKPLLGLFSNYKLVSANLDLWRKVYEEEPWTNAPYWAIRMEEKRLLAILPSDTPKQIGKDFVRRVFAGMALDGILLRHDKYWKNPVILGVESPGVAVLQNVALKKDEKIPVIQLK